MFFYLPGTLEVKPNTRCSVHRVCRTYSRIGRLSGARVPWRRRRRCWQAMPNSFAMSVCRPPARRRRPTASRTAKWTSLRPCRPVCSSERPSAVFRRPTDAWRTTRTDRGQGSPSSLSGIPLCGIAGCTSIRLCRALRSRVTERPPVPGRFGAQVAENPLQEELFELTVLRQRQPQRSC